MELIKIHENDGEYRNITLTIDIEGYKITVDGWLKNDGSKFKLTKNMDYYLSKNITSIINNNLNELDVCNQEKAQKIADLEKQLVELKK